MLNNYGDFVDGDVRTVDKPHIQLLSTVDTSKMYDEFYAARNSQTSSGNTVTFASTITSTTTSNATAISTFASVAGVATSSFLSTSTASATSITGMKSNSSLGASVSTPSPIKTNGSIPAARRGSLIEVNAAVLMVDLTALFVLLQ
jgi:hypothetical protein